MYGIFATAEVLASSWATLKKLRPVAYYAIIPVRSSGSPYSEDGTLWINYNGNITKYGLKSHTKYYIFGSWIAE